MEEEEEEEEMVVVVPWSTSGCRWRAYLRSVRRQGAGGLVWSGTPVGRRTGGEGGRGLLGGQLLLPSSEWVARLWEVLGFGRTGRLLGHDAGLSSFFFFFLLVFLSRFGGGAYQQATCALLRSQDSAGLDRTIQLCTCTSSSAASFFSARTPSMGGIEPLLLLVLLSLLQRCWQAHVIRGLFSLRRGVTATVISD